MLLSRKIRDYGAKYRGKEIKMSTEINSFLNLRNTIEMRIGSYTVFGVIYSISMDSLKLIFQEDTVLPALAKNKNLGSIQLKKNSDSKSSAAFFPFLSVKLLSASAYSSLNKEYNLLTLEFLSPVPEEIAIKVGKLLDLKLGQNQRIHERIIIDKDSIRKLKIDSDKAYIKFNGSKHKCLIKDLSYGGALVISSFDYGDVEEDAIDLVFSFEFMDEEIFIEGKSKSLSVIQTPSGKVFALGIAFDEDKIPLEYTMLIHDYFN
ncbi:c-di-GMP-binding receptor PlzA [Borreliella carolinensis]|uniref:c-di-GMP-binding receptor PlzA n=1 Tax=Borreliella carolinensis TaxID=478174 RepID=UPI0029423884|nr:c-di-GMP-binding receptor PlzA [Borreliella carolinensis]WNY65254.1 c-di-GMP-binding receptor PlzA [Borreliella carolinensis]